MSVAGAGHAGKRLDPDGIWVSRAGGKDLAPGALTPGPVPVDADALHRQLLHHLPCAGPGQAGDRPSLWLVLGGTVRTGDAAKRHPKVCIRVESSPSALRTAVPPVGFQNSATGVDLGFSAARSYSLMRPPRTGRRWICSWERSAQRVVGTERVELSAAMGAASVVVGLYWARIIRRCRWPKISIRPAAQDRFSADLLCVDVGHGGAGSVMFAVGDALRDALVGPGRVVVHLERYAKLPLMILFHRADLRLPRSLILKTEGLPRPASVCRMVARRLRAKLTRSAVQ